MKESISKRERRSQRDYTMAFKLSVVSQVEKGEMTYKEAQRAYGIQGRSTVLVWLRKHGNLDWRKPSIHYMHQSKETPAQKISLALEAPINVRSILIEKIFTIIHMTISGLFS